MSRSQPKAAPRSRRRKGRRQRKAVANALPVVRPQVAGIDLGSREHWACGPPRESSDKPNVEVFESTTPELARLCNWLEGQGIESVAMESTHVYWIPLYEMLESRGIEVLLVNARHLKSVPGRKTDMLDCQWLQKLHSCGLLRGSFRPHESITRLRALHRQLENLVQQRSRIVHWMQQALDQMNVQVHRAVTDLTGKTGMAILRAIVAGERDPLRLAALRDGRCKKTPEQFAAHLTGTWRTEHLFNLERSLSLYDTHQEEIAAYERRLEQELAELACEELRDREPPQHPSPTKEKALRSRGQQPLRTALYRAAAVDLTRIDGISVGASRTIITEIGLDLSAFPSEAQFVAWLGLVPRTAVSGGKALGRKKRGKAVGANRVAGVLRMSAASLKHSPTALGAALRRKARHKGMSVAIFRIARKLARLVYRMLRYGRDYVDIGAEAYEDRFRQRAIASLQARARSLGYTVTPGAPSDPPTPLAQPA